MVDLPKIFSRRITLCPAMAKSCPGFCHVEEFTYLSVAKQTREFNDRHGKGTKICCESIKFALFGCLFGKENEYIALF